MGAQGRPARGPSSGGSGPLCTSATIRQEGRGCAQTASAGREQPAGLHQTEQHKPPSNLSGQTSSEAAGVCRCKAALSAVQGPASAAESCSHLPAEALAGSCSTQAMSVAPSSSEAAETAHNAASAQVPEILAKSCSHAGSLQVCQLNSSMCTPMHMAGAMPQARLAHVFAPAAAA